MKTSRSGPGSVGAESHPTDLLEGLNRETETRPGSVTTWALGRRVVESGFRKDDTFNSLNFTSANTV